MTNIGRCKITLGKHIIEYTDYLTCFLDIDKQMAIFTPQNYNDLNLIMQLTEGTLMIQPESNIKIHYTGPYSYFLDVNYDPRRDKAVWE